MGERRYRIVLAESYSADAVVRLEQVGDVVELESCDADALLEAVPEADALLVRSYANVDDRVIGAGVRLRVIGRGGVGIENIDVAAARSRGIEVVYTPEASTKSVAQHALALMMALERKVFAGDAAMREERFTPFRGQTFFRELQECTLGIVGMGRIGSEFARIAAAGLQMRVIYNDILPVGPFSFGGEPVTAEALFVSADVISLHVPLTRLTRGMVDGDKLGLMSRTSVLINTSRGAVVEMAALAEALEARRIAGAALDVFDPEPLPQGHPLLSAPNLIMSPHVAGRSVGAVERMNGVVEDVIAVLEGRDPRYSASDNP